MTLTVPCLFGLESLVADEMRRLNLKDVRAENESKSAKMQDEDTGYAEKSPKYRKSSCKMKFLHV